MNLNIKNTYKLISRLFKTSSTFMGAVSWKGGKSILVFKDISNRVGLNNSSRNSLLIISSVGIIYTMSFTRLPEFWHKFDLDSIDDEPLTTQNTQSLSRKKIFKIIPYIITIFRAPFNMLNTYAGCQAILSTLGLDPTGVITNILCCYSAISNQVAFNIYTYKSINKNCQRLAEQNIVTNNFDIKKFLLKFFLDLGTVSFSATSYFVSRSCLIDNSWSRDNFSTYTITTICGLSCGSAFVSELFSKNLDLHYLIDHDNDFIKNMTKNRSLLLYPHILMGLIYTLSMAVAYYMGCLNLSEDTSLSDELIDTAWYTILTYLIFGISGGALEFAFAVESMFQVMRVQSNSEISNAETNDNERNPQTDYALLEGKNDSDNKQQSGDDSSEPSPLLWKYPKIKEKKTLQPDIPTIDLILPPPALSTDMGTLTKPNDI